MTARQIAVALGLDLRYETPTFMPGSGPPPGRRSIRDLEPIVSTGATAAGTATPDSPTTIVTVKRLVREAGDLG